MKSFFYYGTFGFFNLFVCCLFVCVFTIIVKCCYRHVCTFFAFCCCWIATPFHKFWNSYEWDDWGNMLGIFIVLIYYLKVLIWSVTSQFNHSSFQALIVCLDLFPILVYQKQCFKFVFICTFCLRAKFNVFHVVFAFV